MCLFCKIINGEIPSERVYEDDDMIIIRDINPKAKVHLLAIPKVHYFLIEEQKVSDTMTLGLMLNKISQLKEKLGVKNGYRLVINQGEDGGQEVKHLHVHILGGEKLGGL